MLLPSLIRALIEEQAVAVSGFGMFSVQHISSQIKEDVIYPPQNIIEFVYNKDIEDFRFVNKLSQWEQIRIDEAHKKISEWADLIEKGLEHNKTVFFEDFGTFSKDASGKIVFQGMIIAQLNIENEGFEPVVLPQKKLKKEDAGEGEPVKDKRVILHKKRKKRDSILFLSVVIAALLLLSVLFLKDRLNPIYQNVVKNIKNVVVHETLENENIVYISKIAEEEVVDFDENIDEIENIDLTLDDIKETTTEKQKDPLNSLSAFTELYLPYHKGSYYLIAGSFAKEESALLHIKQKKLDKYHAKLIIHPDNPRIRVCIGIFDNEEEATRIAAQLDQKYWVLK